MKVLLPVSSTRTGGASGLTTVDTDHGCSEGKLGPEQGAAVVSSMLTLGRLEDLDLVKPTRLLPVMLLDASAQPNRRCRRRRQMEIQIALVLEYDVTWENQSGFLPC